MGKLYFLAGLPRSGKSTIAKSWVNHEISVGRRGIIYSGKESQNVPRTIVCADDIRISLTGFRFNTYAEGMVNTIKHLMICTLLRKHDVIVDGTHTTASSIRHLLEIDKNAIPIFVGTPIDMCKNRAIATGQDDLIPVIDRMVKNLQTLTQTLYTEQMISYYYTAVDIIRSQVHIDMRVANA